MVVSLSANRADAPNAPRIVNIARLRATTRRPTLLHFTKVQWNALIEGIIKVDRVADLRSALQVTEVQGGPESYYFAFPDCPPDCKPLYEHRGRTADTYERILIGCICGLPPQPGQGLSPQPAKCKLGLAFADPLLRIPQLVCIDDKGRICADEKPAIFSKSPIHHFLGCVRR